MTLAEKRRSLDMSLGECARAALLKPSDLSKIERGSRTPTDEECELIGRTVGWSAQEVKAGLPSPEEVAANFARASDALLAMGAVIEDAKSRGFGKGKGGAGEIECPICKGRLRYSVASVNGHMWGVCSNPDCVRWMAR